MLLEEGRPVLHRVPLVNTEVFVSPALDLCFGPLAGKCPPRNDDLKPPALPEGRVFEQAHQGQRAHRRSHAGIRVRDTFDLPKQIGALLVEKAAKGLPLGRSRELADCHVQTLPVHRGSSPTGAAAQLSSMKITIYCWSTRGVSTWPVRASAKMAMKHTHAAVLAAISIVSMRSSNRDIRYLDTVEWSSRSGMDGMAEISDPSILSPVVPGRRCDISGVRDLSV
uniref:FunU16 n=1 Tax=Streptosporangium sp. KD35 TaxID=2162663 RepID=A0A2U9KCY9_9ACTN|nr:FunU16 [Streptosporangium sp. KD35]